MNLHAGHFLKVLFLLLILGIGLVMSDGPPKVYVYKVWVTASRPLTTVEAPAEGAIIVAVGADKRVILNGKEQFGMTENCERLTARLQQLFQERAARHHYRPSLNDCADGCVNRAVVLKAARSLSYREVAQVIEAVKGSRADPVILQIDGLEP